MRQALEKVLVDHRWYEEAIQEIMRKGKSWDEIASYIDGMVKEAESIGERHGTAVEILPPSKSLEELKRKIETLEIPAPDVSLGVWGEGRDGVLEVFIKNRSPLPLAVEIELEGATPLRPLKKVKLRPHSSESWRVPVIVEGQRVAVRIAYRSLGVERGGTVERTAVLRPAGTPKYVNVAIPTLERLDKEEVMAIRYTTDISIGSWRPSAYLGEGGFYHAFLALKRGEEAVLKNPQGAC